MINVIQGLGHDGIYCHHDMLKNTQYLQKEKKTFMYGSYLMKQFDY